jgi:protein gp37
MSNKTGIAWTDETANWIVGCSKISQGCRSCYAATAANSPRLQQFDQYKGVVDGDGNWNGEIAFVPKVLGQLIRSKKRRRVFAPSMGDPFHQGVKDEWLDQFFVTVALTPHITYQVLTKRPERMLEYCDRLYGDRFRHQIQLRGLERDENLTKIYNRNLPLSNLWLGVTVENEAAANERIPLLLQTPAAVRFLSVEPLLEAIDLVDGEMHNPGFGEGHPWLNPLGGIVYDNEGNFSCAPAIDWGIIGGESGSAARPFEMEWAQLLINQFQEAKIPIFMKQVGSNAFYEGKPFKTKSRAGSDPKEWPEWAQIQEFPDSSIIPNLESGEDISESF